MGLISNKETQETSVMSKDFEKVVDDVVSAVVQRSTEILLASRGGEPIPDGGPQTIEDVAELLAGSVFTRFKQKLVDAVPQPDSKDWPF
jgi:hypothetical protein